MSTVTYSIAVHVSHDDSGDVDIDVDVKDVGHSKTDRESVAWALRAAADLVENGEAMPKSMFS